MVMAILKKHNYGHLPVADYNQFAKHAQLFIFEGLFQDLNDFINKEIARLSGSGVASMTDGINETIDTFTRQDTLTHLSANTWNIPTLSTVGHDMYKMRELSVYNNGTYQGVSEKLNVTDSMVVLNSLWLAPSTRSPLHTIEGEVLTIYPATISGDTTWTAKARYIRYPKDPNWTYVNITAGEPTYNSSAVDHQDFELSKEFEYLLAAKILQMAGLHIREMDVYKFAKGEEMQLEPKQQTYRR